MLENTGRWGSLSVPVLRPRLWHGVSPLLESHAWNCDSLIPPSLVGFSINEVLFFLLFVVPLRSEPRMNPLGLESSFGAVQM